MHQRQQGAARAKVASASPETPTFGSSPLHHRAVANRSVFQERVAFLRGFVANPQQVGSVIPSSQLLERRLVRCADLARAQCVVELGPGTGGTTRALLAALPPGAHLLAIELSADFAERLRSSITDPRLIVAQGSAEHIGQFLAQYQLPAPDAVISGIPFSTMPEPVADGIAAEIARVLAPRGRFVAYQVRAAVAGYASPYLGQPRKQWEFVNIPPVQVFTWTRQDRAKA
jgi:phosphatidylethanolamine/phosphatidyl-N-methylethanolamine N-methyltransferase